VVLSSKPNKVQTTAVKALFTYLSVLSKSSDAGHQDIAVQSYSSVLRTQNTREIFWADRKETVDPLLEILRAGAGTTKDSTSTLWSNDGSTRGLESGIAGGVGIQLIYRVLLVFWQLSFEAELVGQGLQEYDH
jgi:V-type H+-transporting ATPase subunit H